MTGVPREAPGAPLRLRLALALIDRIRPLVPAHLRRRWRDEWQAELLHRHRHGGSLRPALAALPHAASLRWRHWSLEAMLQDLRYALRQVRRAPGVSALVVMTMALGIGANSLVYSVLNSTVRNPLPFDNADRIVYIWKEHPRNSWWVTPSMDDIHRWREQIDGLERIETVRGQTYSVTGLETPRRINGARISAGFFDMVGAAPVLGRAFSDEENRNGEPVAVVSHRLWQTVLGGADDVLGRTLQLDGKPYTVIGVMPPSFRMQSPFALAELWTPLLESEPNRGVSAIGLVEPGATLEQVNEELKAVASPTEDGSSMDEWLAQARRPNDFLSGEYTRTVWSLQGAVGLVLLIATANVVNLLLARGSVRRQEMAVRTALGGSRARLVRQLLTESMVLAVAGGVLGLGLAVGGVGLIDRLRPEDLDSLGTLRLDPRVVLVTLAITLAAGLTAGLLPALQGAGGNLQRRMAALSGRVSEERGRRRARSALVVAEVALSTVLAITAALLVGSFVHLQRVDPGFVADHLLTLRVSPSALDEADETAGEQYWKDLRRAVRTALGPRAAGLTLSVGVPPQTGVEFGDPVREDGVPVEVSDSVTSSAWVDPDYFDVLQLRWSGGSSFGVDAGDTADARGETDEVDAVISEGLARQIWPNEPAIGRRVRFASGPDEPWRRIVGVVGDVKAFGLASDNGGRQIYYRLGAGEDFGILGEGSLMMTVRTTGPALDAATTVRQAIWSVDPDAPITEMGSMRERLAGTIALPRFNAMLMSALAAVGLGLALVGIYGVLSYSVARRRHELGVRMALGATRTKVLALVGTASLRLVAAGLVLGVAGSLAAGSLLASMLHGVEPTHPGAYAAVALILAAVGTLATWVPATRATRVDPALALREE